MNPIVLADNRFLDGTPTANGTLSGFSVLNVRDLKEYMSWRQTGVTTSYLTVDCGASKYADALGIKKHNLGTAVASVSVDSSENGTDWTQRLAPFTPSNDKAILKTFTPAAGRHWRVKVASTAMAADIAVCLLGEAITFPFSPEGPYVPASNNIEAETARGKTGTILGTIVRFKPYRINPRWNTVPRTFVEDTFLPFWNDYASNLAPFFYGWDLTAFPSDVRFVSVPADHSFETPVSVLAYYDSITLPMEGVVE